MLLTKLDLPVRSSQPITRLEVYETVGRLKKYIDKELGFLPMAVRDHIAGSLPTLTMVDEGEEHIIGIICHLDARDTTGEAVKRSMLEMQIMHEHIRRACKRSSDAECAAMRRVFLPRVMTLFQTLATRLNLAYVHYNARRTE